MCLGWEPQEVVGGLVAQHGLPSLWTLCGISNQLVHFKNKEQENRRYPKTKKATGQLPSPVTLLFAPGACLEPPQPLQVPMVSDSPGLGPL